MTWLALLKALLIAVDAFLGWLKQRQLVIAAQAETISAALANVLDEIRAAELARSRARDALQRDPSKLRDDDGFRRSD